MAGTGEYRSVYYKEFFAVPVLEDFAFVNSQPTLEAFPYSISYNGMCEGCH